MSKRGEDLSSIVSRVLRQREAESPDSMVGSFNAAAGAVQPLLALSFNDWDWTPQRKREYMFLMVVRLTAALEYSLRTCVQRTIDNVGGASIPHDLASKLGNQKLSIADVHGAFQSNITLGELASAGQSFRDPAVAISYAKKLIGPAFIDAFKTDHVSDLRGDRVLSWIGEIQGWVQMRHEICHGLARGVATPSFEDLSRYYNQFFMFTFFFSRAFVKSFASLCRADGE